MTREVGLVIVPVIAAWTRAGFWITTQKYILVGPPLMTCARGRVELLGSSIVSAEWPMIDPGGHLPGPPLFSVASAQTGCLAPLYTQP